MSMPRRSRLVFLPTAALVVLAAAWSVFWFTSAGAIERNITAWIDHEAGLGRVISCGSRTTGGFPFRFELRCSEPSVVFNREPNLVLKAKELVAVAQVYQPNLLIVEISGPLDASQRDVPGTVFVSDWSLAQMSVRGRPDRPERISLVLDRPTLGRRGSGALEPLAAADHAEVHVRLDPMSTAERPILDLAAQIVGASVPGTLMAQKTDGEVAAVLRGLSDLNPRPLADHLRALQAAGGQLEVLKVRLKQGDAIVLAKGDLGLSAQAKLNGVLNVTMTGVEKLAPALFLGEASRAQAGAFASFGLSLLGRRAEIEGRQAREVELRFSDDGVMLGKIPLARLPPLY